MAGPRTRRSTIGADPFAAVIPQVVEALPAVTPKPRRVRRMKPERPAENTARPPPEGVQSPVAQPALAGRQKLTVHLDGALVNRVKNAAYWNPRLTIARIAEQGIRAALEKVEKENGGPYPQRESELIGGRPIK